MSVHLERIALSCKCRGMLFALLQVDDSFEGRIFNTIV
jgi:hypothetical protein